MNTSDAGKFLIARTPGSEDLPLPARMSEGAAGMDLYADVRDEVALKPGEIKLIPAGVRISLPRGFEAQIRPRSGLAAKYGVTVANAPGTVDSDYRGEIKIIMINHGKEDFIVHRGDRVAQMVINRIETPVFELVETLGETERGEGGFGHTGRSLPDPPLSEAAGRQQSPETAGCSLPDPPLSEAAGRQQSQEAAGQSDSRSRKSFDSDCHPERSEGSLSQNGGVTIGERYFSCARNDGCNAVPDFPEELRGQKGGGSDG